MHGHDQAAEEDEGLAQGHWLSACVDAQVDAEPGRGHGLEPRLADLAPAALAPP